MKNQEEINELLFNCIVKFDEQTEKPILGVQVLEPLASSLKDIIYLQVEDIEKEEASALAIDRFKDYLTLLQEDGTIVPHIFTKWWEVILSYFSMYTPDLNKNMTEIKLYGRVLNFLKLGAQGQDPRYVAGPENLTLLLKSCKAIVAMFEHQDTIEIFKARIPQYLSQDTVEKQNGGFINARKVNAMCELIKMLEPDFEYIPMLVREDQVHETNRFNNPKEEVSVAGQETQPTE